MAPEPSLKELKKLVKDFYSKMPKASAKKDHLKSWANEMGLTQIEGKVTDVTNKVAKKNAQDLLKPDVNLLPDNTHQAPSLPLKPKSVSRAKKTKVSMPEELHNYKNLHAKSHKTVIIPGLALQHLEDAQHKHEEIERERHMPILLQKHISESVKDLRQAVDTKSKHHVYQSMKPEANIPKRKFVIEEEPKKVNKEVQAVKTTKDSGHNPMPPKANEGLMEYRAFIKSKTDEGMSNEDARSAWHSTKKERDALKKEVAKVEKKVKKAEKKAVKKAEKK